MGEWVRTHMVRLHEPPPRDGHEDEDLAGVDLGQIQTAFACTNEDIRMIIRTMASQGHEPVFSMGDDIPLAVLSQMHRPLPFYFRQRFAQVTNPPIDPLREELVMSLDCYLGPRGSVFEETPEHARVVHLASPLSRPGPWRRCGGWRASPPPDLPPLSGGPGATGA